MNAHDWSTVALAVLADLGCQQDEQLTEGERA